MERMLETLLEREVNSFRPVLIMANTSTTRRAAEQREHHTVCQIILKFRKKNSTNLHVIEWFIEKSAFSMAYKKGLKDQPEGRFRGMREIVDFLNAREYDVFDWCRITCT